jgi:hypothetical protein
MNNSLTFKDLQKLIQSQAGQIEPLNLQQQARNKQTKNLIDLTA